EREQVNRPVDSAEDGEVAGKRGDIGEFRVVHFDGKEVVVVEANVVGDVEAEGAKCAAMRADVRAVEVNIRDDRGGFEPDVNALGGVFPGDSECGAIPAWAAVVGAAVGAVFSVERVGEGDGLPGFVGEAWRFSARGTGA